MVHMFETHIMQFSTFIHISYVVSWNICYQTHVGCKKILFHRLHYNVLQ